MNKKFRNNFILFFILFICSTNVFSKDFINIEKTNVSISNRKAILVLVGLGGNKKRMKIIFNELKNKGYDLFIPYYKNRKNILLSSKNIDNFCIKQQLSEYKELHVYSFILGSWTLNSLLKNEHVLTNIKSIVYDRGPIQEKLALEMIKANRGFYTTIVGDVLEDFSNTTYPPNLRKNIKLGILIETGVSKMAYKFRKEINSNGTINFFSDSLNQKHDDYIYIAKGHDDMYNYIKDYSYELFFFFEKGIFSEQNRTIPDKLSNIKIQEK